MTNKIQLQYPFSNDWDCGYLITNTENRKMVLLYSSPPNRKQSTVSYARYIMSIKLGRYLTKDECVDHIDEDKTHDVIDNFQILSRSDNCRKHTLAHMNTLVHGTYAMYRTGGCRCEACRKANCDMQRKSYLKHKDEYNARRRARRQLKKSDSN